MYYAHPQPGPARRQELQTAWGADGEDRRSGLNRSRPATRANWRRIVLLPILGVGACATNFGPRTVGPTRFDYNQRIAQSTDQQILLNVVRLRYRDTPYFLDVGSVLVQYEVDRKLSGSATAGFKGGPGALGGTAEVDALERPTITYVPIAGEAFVKRLLSPIPIRSLALLGGSGWSIARLLSCCMDGVNDISNVPSAAGPTPAIVTVDPRFQELASLLRSMQVDGSLEIFPAADGSDSCDVRIEPADSATPRESIAARLRIRALLRLPEGLGDIAISPFSVRSRAPVRVRQRSLLGVMFYLSQAVDVPDEDVQAGLVTVAKDRAGTAADWGAITGGIFHVHVATERPPSSFAAVRYRDHWFYIADSDLQSKTTFNLLSYLFQLQSVQSHGAVPLVTVGAGN
jgi:hypothetical protein